MFSTSISGVLIALLITSQTLVAVSALPTTTTTTIMTSTITTTTSTSAQLETRKASDSNRNNSNNNHGNGNNYIVSPNNTTTSKEFAIRAMLSQFDKRNNSANNEHQNNDMSLGEILAIVIAALTLLVAMIPLFQCSRFRCWVSSISPLVKKALGITLPSPVPTPVTTLEGPNSIPAPVIPIPSPVFVYNDYSNTRFLGTCITREDGRTPQVEESLAPRRLERVVTYPFP